MKGKSFMIIMALMLLAFLPSDAQNSSNVITMKTEKIFEFNSKVGQVIINAERGHIRIQSWERNEVSVSMILSAKNKNSEVAEKELGFMKYNLVKSRDNIFLNNKMVLPDSRKEISSIVSVKYEIKVPGGAYLIINDRFGRVSVKDCSGIITGDLNYCDLFIEGYDGSINMNISIGDFSCADSKIKGTIKTRHSNLDLKEIQGKLDINCEFGTFNFAIADKTVQVALSSHATDIVIENKNCLPLELTIDGSYCPAKIASDCYVKDKIQTTYKPDEEQESWMIRYTPALKSTSLRIKADFGTINLK